MLVLVSIISALSLAAPCAAQSGYEIRSAIVTPEYGYEDFTYSSQVWMNEEAASELGVIAVTKFSLKLNIYDNGVLIHTESSDQRGLSKTSFVFGPYSFKDRFGITSTSNATFEYIFYAGSQQVAKTARIKGPIVQPPTLTGTPSFEKKPYFFQGIAVSAGFKDMDGLNPKPTCHLEITGPLGTADSRSWITADVSCQSSGKSTYSCTVAENLSSYRNGGEFTFKLVYNNLKLDPLTYGPYNISLQPYNPALEKVTIPKLLDYTNFTIQAYVKDAGAKIVGNAPDGSVANLVISHPQKGEISYSSSEPAVRGSSLVYEWTRDSSPPLFNRSDVQLAKNAPFQAKVVYKNENWDYQAEKSNLSFRVVEEIPKLDLQYPSTVYVRAGESITQDIIAIVAFSKGAGDMSFKLSGPDQDLNLTEKGVPLAGNRYQYKWQVAFDDRHINNNYTLGLSFVHPTLEGGRYAFEDKFIKVAPLSVQFSQGLVSPTTGLWNESYTYSLKIDTTIVPLEVRLQTYDPCSNEWTDKGAKKATVESSWLNWTVKPFGYECREMQQEGAKYRFKASFAGNDYASKPYQGPTFKGGKPVLISLNSDPVVYVSEGRDSSSSIQAVVEYGAGQGQAVLRLTGPEKNIDETSEGIALGGNRYRYEWSLPFEETDIGKSFNYTISYKHSSLAAEMLLAEKSIAVKAISINFAGATVVPNKGKWNETYAYSVPVSTSVEMKVALEVYNSCSREWLERSSATTSPGERLVNLTAKPFKYKCAEAEGKNASYRFVARFAEERIESDVYTGPFISGGKPELISLDYTPILYVTEDVPVYQVVKAIVDSPLGQGAMDLSINGPEMNFTEEVKGTFLSGQRYAYTWTIPLGIDNAGNHTLSPRYLHPEIAGGKIAFPEQSMRVKEKDEIIKFDQASVTPANGSIFTGFAYCVNVTSNLKNYDVELFTQEPGSAKWISQGTIPYNGTSQALCWPEVVIDGSHYGMAKYRFSSGLSASDIFEGPSIEPVSFINSTISPTHGPLYITTPLLGEISRVYMYTITVQFMKPLAGNMREVKLEVYDPSSESWLYAGSQTYDATKTKIVFKVNFAGLPFQEPFLGETKYRLLAYSENLGEFVGPTIDVNLKNERAIASGKNYTYQLEVRSSLPKVDIALAYTKNNVNWLKGDKRTYESSNQEWKALKWEKYPKHYAYEFEVDYA